MPGPLPNPNHLRRNAPTIPTTALPVSGRPGRAPSVPSWTTLGKAGSAWWRWAWKTPQAAGWGAQVGFEAMVARRARLEDDLAVLEHSGTLGPVPDDPEDLREWLKNVEALVRTLQRMATGELAVMREMRELDDRLGLTPKGLAALRWTIVGEAPADGDADSDAEDEVERKRRERRGRLASNA